MSERTAYKHHDRGDDVIPEVMEVIVGTKLDTGTYLDKLKGQTPSD